MTDVQFINRSQEVAQVYLVVGGVQWTDSRLFGPIKITQWGIGSTVRHMVNVHVNGNNKAFDFYYLKYGQEPNGVISGCTFEKINGWALTGRFDTWKIVRNLFSRCSGVDLECASGNTANKPNDALIQHNTFEHCPTVLQVYWGTTAETHRNLFCDNLIAGKCITIYAGTAAGTTVYWRGNRASPGLTYTTLARNCGFTLNPDMSSSYDDIRAARIISTDNASTMWRRRPWSRSSMSAPAAPATTISTTPGPIRPNR